MGMNLIVAVGTILQLTAIGLAEPSVGNEATQNFITRKHVLGSPKYPIKG